MKLGSFNVENLFMRARAMNGATLAEGKDVCVKAGSVSRDHAALWADIDV